MNRAKYRIWLISLVVLAAACGIFYYVQSGRRNTEIPEGTLVQQLEVLCEGAAV